MWKQMCFFSFFRSKTWVWFWSLTNRSPHLLVLTCARHRLITFDHVSSAPLVLTVTMQKVSLFSLSCREEKLIKHWILIRTFKCRYTAHYECSKTRWEPGVFQAPVCCHAPSSTVFPLALITNRHDATLTGEVPLQPQSSELLYCPALLSHHFSTIRYSLLLNLLPHAICAISTSMKCT